jgi:PIN domain nuclease of toxin-antitoxin system
MSGLGISSISVWEVAKLVERDRLQLQIPVEEWLAIALDYPGIQMVHMTPEIYVESTRLPGTFHKDPADQIIVATARILDLELMTFDSEILQYPHVRSMGR